MYICIYIHIHNAHIFPCTSIQVHTSSHGVHICMRAYAYAYAYAYVFTDKHTYMYAYTTAYACAHVHAFAHMSSHGHAHTHTHTQTHTQIHRCIFFAQRHILAFIHACLRACISTHRCIRVHVRRQVHPTCLWLCGVFVAGVVVGLSNISAMPYGCC